MEFFFVLAVKTMEFSELTLINPCDYLSDRARWLAHASNDILEQAKVLDNLPYALKSFDFVIGTTAKKRSVKKDYFPLSGLTQLLVSKGNSVNKVAIVFGREESGLKNQELKCCDIVSTVPLQTSYPSRNLAQAIMLYAYELSKLNYRTETHYAENKESFPALKQKAHAALREVGFKKETNIYPRFMERLSFLTQDDVHLLHSFCNKFLENEK